MSGQGYAEGRDLGPPASRTAGPGGTPEGEPTGGLRVSGLGVALPDARGGHQTVLEQVDLRVPHGRLVVLLGPSGAGKSTLLAALLGLLPTGSLVRGHGWWEADGTEPADLVDPGAAARERLRGRVAAWLPQAPVGAMTPVLTVGHHLTEKARVHVPASRVPAVVGEAMRRHDVDPAWRRRLPSQLSGGQAQRVSNALALLGDPGLVLADEPTTGLDRPRARAAADGLAALAHDEGRAVLVVTHDLRLAEEAADAVIELDGGRSRGADVPAGEVIARARGATHRMAPHATTGQRLQAAAVRPPAAAAPRPGATAAGPRRQASAVDPGTGEGPGLGAVDLTLRRGRGTLVRSGVTLQVRPDRTTGLMAPSGAGKTTLLRTLALLHRPSEGQVRLDGRPVRGTGYAVPAAVRRRIAFVPQDPRQGVDPRWTLGRSLLEPSRLVGRTGDDTEVARMLDRVGLAPELASRRPDEVSGGQLQRAVLARALALDADYLLLDEPTSMVDAATARAVVRAVHEHQHATGCGVLVASHDEELLRTWCDVVVEW
ncbi:ATP-binding cassette domain-containing protein [uncultured Serinicoccus sp.]|uniref:ATP-binding cassette domain-containing protein n=1 Tax=uncultured Serinicoccus sp. TaxID=735514 RepID=UPI002625A9B8|nr:ATP-binding cassette domain-containing protein [uncultured Serinicoccus sp.]